MNKFKKIYDKLMLEINNISEDEREFIDFNNLSNNYNVITEDTFNILNEYVKDPELTPVPKEFLNIICSRVKYRRDNITIISMRELYNILREYEYPYYQEFKDNLKEFTGNLYIVMLFDKNYSYIQNDYSLVFNKTYLFVNSYINNSEISLKLCKEILKDKHKNVDAFCSKTDNSLKNNKFFQENGLIFVSLKGEFIKDSLEHELTHFVQKTVGSEKSLKTIKNDSKLNDIELQNENSFKNLCKWINNFANEESALVNYLLQFFSVKFKTSELHQSVKAVLNGFQRMYEYGKFSYIANLTMFKREVDKEEAKHNIYFRLQWLKIFLNVINSEQFINNDLKPVIYNFQTDIEPQQYIIKNRSYFIILLYFGFKNMFPNLNIDEKLQEHFSIFKYKDN